MSEFLLTIPEGWSQLDWPFISNNCIGLSTTDVRNGVISDIETNLKLSGIIAETDSLQDFKLIDDTYFMIKLG